MPSANGDGSISSAHRNVSINSTKQGTSSIITRAKTARAAQSGSGKGKSKPAAVAGEADSDSSFDGYQPSSRSGENVRSQAYDVGEEADVDGMEDGDADDYVVRTDHLRSDDVD